jgi:hypothetical protein
MRSIWPNRRTESDGQKRNMTISLTEGGASTPILGPTTGIGSLYPRINRYSRLIVFRVVIWALLGLVLLMAPGARMAQAQTSASTPDQAEIDEEKLERDFTNPLTTLPQLIVRDAFSPATYGTHVQTNQAIIRPIIPRVPPQSLLPFDQLIRPTFALVTVPSPRGGSRTEFGDTAMFDLAVLPWPPKESGILVGVGPTFVFPTATSTSAGQGAWQAGPALGAIYTGIPGLLVGFIAQNPISFASTSPNRPSQNTFQFQPVMALHLWEKWYLRSAEANWAIGWCRHTPTTMPLSVGIGRTIVRPGLPPMSLFVGGQWTVYRQFAPVTPQTTINFGMTVAFPELKSWN